MKVLLLLILCLIKLGKSQTYEFYEANFESNVTKILNQVLRNYDKDVRPPNKSMNFF